MSRVINADILIAGGGFSGSLLATILARHGMRVVLVERNRHPRFAIGESTTPTGNMAIRRISEQYDLPFLLSLSAYGTWKETYPGIACGSKRGFSYFFHEEDQPFAAFGDHRNELLVAANPDRERADTHWFRADVDAFLFEQAGRFGAVCMEETEIEEAVFDRLWSFRIRRERVTETICAPLAFDASGRSSVIAKALQIPEHPSGLRTRSQSLFGHFTDVTLWTDACPNLSTADHPFPCDEAALHHLFQGGWMWNLRFDNGITSAGFMLAPNAASRSSREPANGAREFRDRLNRLPTVRSAFENASPVRPITATGELQFRRSRLAESHWALLPASAYFLDPLHSTGLAHSLCCVERLAAMALAHPDKRPAIAATYDTNVQCEIDLLDRIIHAGYASLHDPSRFLRSAMLYFFGATFTEHAARAEPPLPTSFLHFHDPAFADLIRAEHARLTHGIDPARRPNSSIGPCNSEGNEIEMERFARRFQAYNKIGLCDPARRNMYPFL